MDDPARQAIKKQFLDSIMGIKRTMSSFHQWRDLHVGEIIALKHIGEHGMSGGGYISELQSNLNVSKPAVSQMMGVLEKKGYLEREVSASDRRMVAVRLTDKGQEAYRHLNGHFETVLDSLLDRFGEEESRQLIGLLERLTRVVESIKAEIKES